MLKLYAQKGCPHCAKVLEVLHQEIAKDFEVHYISDPKNADIVKEGGKLQVPYLVDEEKGVSLYESDDIIAHLKENYGG